MNRMQFSQNASPQDLHVRTLARSLRPSMSRARDPQIHCGRRPYCRYCRYRLYHRYRPKNPAPVTPPTHLSRLIRQQMRKLRQPSRRAERS